MTCFEKLEELIKEELLKKLTIKSLKTRKFKK